MEDEQKAHLREYLQYGRDVLLWKLEGLSEYDARRPMTPTGTNLLGLVKHVIGVEAGYLGDVFGRPFTEPLPWLDEEEDPNVDMWAKPDESRDYLTGLYRNVWRHSDATIESLPLDTVGRVPHWAEERANISLHKAVTHVIMDTHRHAGHADIVREMVDGSAGFRADVDNLAPGDAAWWAAYRERVEAAARQMR